MSAVHADTHEPNDPTRSGSPLPPGKGARLSHNEIEQLCLKAARGAGMSWGLAEEAGFAAAWLALRGLDGPGALLSQLRGAAGRSWQQICPVVTAGGFHAGTGGCLCPIALGAALCDHARLPQTAMDAAQLRVGPVDHPVLLLPFLADLARVRGTAIALSWDGGRVVVAVDGGLSGDAEVLARETRLEADLSLSPPGQAPKAQAGASLYVSADIQRGLNELALRTTVPASEASRAGAGAVAGDND